MKPSTGPRERQPNESAKAFAAFSLYFDLGPARSLAAAAKKLGKSKSLIAAWSSKHHWQDRIAAQGSALGPSGSDPKAPPPNPNPAPNPPSLPSLPSVNSVSVSASSASPREIPSAPSPSPHPSHVSTTLNPQPGPSPEGSLNSQLPTVTTVFTEPPAGGRKSERSTRSVKSPSAAVSPEPLNHSMPLNPQLSTLNFWDQQPGEGDKPFSAFTAYLALGPGRSLSKAAKTTGRTRDQLAHWSQRWHWRARAAAYHAHLAAIERKATEQLVAEKSRDWAATHEAVRRQAWAEADDLIALAQDFKARWRDSDRLPDFGALIRALDLAFKLKQFAAGMPSEIKEVNTTLKATIDVEWEAAIRKAYGTQGSDASPQPSALVAPTRPAEAPGQRRKPGEGGPVVDVEELKPAALPAPTCPAEAPERRGKSDPGGPPHSQI